MNRRYNSGFRTLVVWQEAMKLTLHIYEVTKNFPKEELFHLVSQLRRAASSIAANIAEGSAMPTKAHRDSFYARARGSTVEVDTFVELSFGLKYLQEKQANELQDHCARLTYLLTKLMNSR